MRGAPRETKVDVTKCHACHAKRRWMSPSATPATQKCRGVTRDQGAPSASPDPAQSHKCHACHAKRRWMSPSATPARDQRAPSAPPDPAQSQKCHACHAKVPRQTRHQTQPSPISATPVTQKEGRVSRV